MDIDMKTIYFPLFIYGMGMGLKGTSMRPPDYNPKVNKRCQRVGMGRFNPYLSVFLWVLKSETGAV